MTNYLKKEHFENIAPKGATIERLSSKACEYSINDWRCKEYGIIYVDTIVYKEKKTEQDYQITLNSDWRQTKTTKKRINHWLNWLYDLVQRKWQRLLTRHIPNIIDETVEFYDGITL